MLISEIKCEKPVALALGNFDGLHLGHKSVIELAVNNPFGCESAVVYFVPHPREVITGKAVELILNENWRNTILREMGVERQIKIDFNAVRDMEPEKFFQRLISEIPVKMICCGYNFRFGSGGSGDAALLEKLCRSHGIQFSSSDAVEVHGVPVSSSVIRSFIREGEIKKAESMLGRRMIYDLVVEDGDHRGRTIGFPTINQELPDELVRPRFGVYASAVLVNGKWMPAITNIGIRPTYRVEKPLFETFIMGFDGNLYGQSIKLRLVEFIRGETKFSSLDELKSAIENDLKKAVSIKFD